MSGMRKKLVFKFAKGFRGRNKNCHRIARNRVEKALQHAYRGRKVKKRVNRRTWIQQIKAASMEYHVPYNQMIYGLDKRNIKLNRKMLAELAQNEPLSFQCVVAEVLPEVKMSPTKAVLEDEAGYITSAVGIAPETMDDHMYQVVFGKK